MLDCESIHRSVSKALLTGAWSIGETRHVHLPVIRCSRYPAYEIVSSHPDNNVRSMKIRSVSLSRTHTEIVWFEKYMCASIFILRIT